MSSTLTINPSSKELSGGPALRHVWPELFLSSLLALFWMWQIQVLPAWYDEAITLLRHAVPETVAPHPAALRRLRHATTQLIRHTQPGVGREPDPPELAPLRAAGVPVVDDALFRHRLEAEADHRRRLAAFADESLWSRPDHSG